MSAWDDAVLVVDDDLTQFESSMPQAAKKVRGESGASAYDNKRSLAKDMIGKWLVRRSYVLSGITNPTADFKRAATLLELSLIYRDMARKNDTFSEDKANYYKVEYETEIEGLTFAYTAPPAPVDSPFERGSATLWRS